MYIDAPLDGFVDQLGPLAGDDTECIRLQVPVAFKRVTTVNEELLDCRVKELCIKNTKQPLSIISPVSIRPFPKERRHQTIERRPLPFQSEDYQDTNTLIFEFDVRCPEAGINSLNEATLCFVFDFIFLSHTTLQFSSEILINLEAQKLYLKRFQRTTSQRRVLFNLALLVFALLPIALWNLFMNVGVHNQPSNIAQNMVTTVVGAILAFFGLSITKIKNWFKTISNFADIVEYPELHLHATTVSFFAARSATLLLGVILIGAGIFVWYNWSVELERPKDARLSIYDPDDGGVVTAHRAYWRDASRLVVACSGARLEDDNRALGQLIPSVLTAKADPFMFEITYPAYMAPERSGRGDDTPFTERIDGFELLEINLPEGTVNAVVTSLCGLNREDAVYAQIEEGAHKRQIGRIQLRAAKSIESKYLHASLTGFRTKRLRREIDPADIWANRSTYVNDAEEVLRNHQGVIGAETLLTTSKELLKEITDIGTPDIFDRRKVITRTILLRALLRSYKDRPSEGPDHLLIGRLIDQVKLKFDRASLSISAPGNHWQVLVGTWEYLLEIEKLFPSASGDQPHVAIERPGDDWLIKQGPEALLRYLTASIFLECLDSKTQGAASRVEFFRSKSVTQALRRKVGSVDGVIDWIRSNEKLPQSIEKDLSSLLADLWPNNLDTSSTEVLQGSSQQPTQGLEDAKAAEELAGDAPRETSTGA